ncbi:MAG: spermidine/putrescine ABC transporter substrate-binding protein [Clostridia bacterium]|nr:spermidine/putrescine ABC transporter substrate-binding protein [Clostridia bacterium]
MKKKILSVLLLVAILAVIPAFSSCGGNDLITLNVYNWGEYISDGSEGTLDVNSAFEDYCAELGLNVKVNYSTYASNEDMFNKLDSGASSYDIVVPSDYMVERMIANGMLEPLNFDNIPNFKYINDSYKNPFYDPQNLYTVPYTYGMVGIIYNSAYVDEADIGSWDLMWNEKYSGKILQYNNPRDAFGTAMYKLGIDVNTDSTEDWQRALDELKTQKPLIQSYVMDEIYNKMKGESAYISSYYAGDYLTMYSDNEDLAFYYPEEGTNIFVDAMCIPKGSRNKEIAEMYINFMLSEEPAIANAEYIGYASPNSLVYENEQYIADMQDWHPDSMDILYPELDTDGEYVASYYKNLPEESLSTLNSLWAELKIDTGTETWVYVTSLVIVLSLAAFLIYRAVVRKLRSRMY